MKNLYFLFLIPLSLTFLSLQAQDIPVKPSTTVTGTYWGVSRPLRDIQPMTAEEFRKMEEVAKNRTLNKDLGTRIFPYKSTALPKGADPARQAVMGSRDASTGPLVNFDGQTSPYFPPDCNGTAGPNHFMQTINTVYAIYDKTGNLVAGPTPLNQLFGSVPGANRNDGDPIILYDEAADRWLVTEFSIPYSGTNYVLMAVSTTNDPTGTWHQYSFPVASLPDYPKYSVWRDGYYMGDNNGSGNDIYVFEREQMLVGGTAQMVGFNNPWRPTSVDGFMCVPPVDNDGTLAPEGTPGLYIAFNDDALGGGTDQLWLYELTVDWTNTAASGFVRTQQIEVEPFSSDFGNDWNNIEQKGVSQRVDAIPQVIMNVPQYRNFGSYQTIVCCHTVNVNGVRHAGIRWYELRKTTGQWEVRQQGTYAPDVLSRWMGSIMLNGSGEIGLAYSVSATTEYPGIRYCGQSAGAFAAGNSTLDLQEDTIIVGSNSQTGANRWGDYAQVSVDPSDDKTFWFTTQYIGQGNARKTRIASFKYDFAPFAQTVQATAITSQTANLHGKVNPNGLNTEYHFQYGLNVFNLDHSTPVQQAGAGNDTLPVSAGIEGLLDDTTYYFRVVASSSGGNKNGSKLSFRTPAAPFLNVTPPHQNVSVMAGNTEYYVSSNVDWTVTCDADWCTVTPGGSGNDTITATFSENLLVTLRSAVITVTGTGLGITTVTLTQDGSPPTLTVSPINQQVPFYAGKTTFAVLSNTNWTASSDSPWCTVTQAGFGVGVIEAVYDTNFTSFGRICTITVLAPGAPANLVTVTQDGLQLEVNPLHQDVPFTEGTAIFNVTSNIVWTTESFAEWCTTTPSGGPGGQIVATFQANTTNQERTANIQVLTPAYRTVGLTLTQAKSSIGIPGNENAMFRITPNPTDGLFRIIPVKEYRQDISAEIRDMQGRLVLKRKINAGNDYRFDLGGASPGTYQVIIRSDEGISVAKLVLIK